MWPNPWFTIDFYPVKSGGLVTGRDVVEDELHSALSQVDLRLNGQADLTEFIQVLQVLKDQHFIPCPAFLLFRPFFPISSMSFKKI